MLIRRSNEALNKQFAFCFLKLFSVVVALIAKLSPSLIKCLCLAAFGIETSSEDSEHPFEKFKVNFPLMFWFSHVKCVLDISLPYGNGTFGISSHRYWIVPPRNFYTSIFPASFHTVCLWLFPSWVKAVQYRYNQQAQFFPDSIRWMHAAKLVLAEQISAHK